MYYENEQVKLNYECLGNMEGLNLIFLHGNGESLEIFRELSSLFLEDYCIYLVDSRNHGKSRKEKELTYDLMSNDLESFIGDLHIVNPSIVGFSDGAIIALLLAIRGNVSLDKLILMGGNINPQGIKLKTRVLMHLAYLVTRSKKIKLMLREPNIKKEELKKITNRTMVLYGQNDLIIESQRREIQENIQDSVLWELRGESHTSYVVNSKRAFEFIEMFLGK